MPEGMDLCLWAVIAAISVCGSIRIFGNGHDKKWKKEKEELVQYISDLHDWFDAIEPRIHHRFTEEDSLDFEKKVEKLGRHVERLKRN